MGKNIEAVGYHILTPTVRFLASGKKVGKLYHAVTVRNDRGIPVNGVIYPFYTKGCNKVDSTGFCAGHYMRREDFVRLFCDGKDPLEQSDASTDMPPPEKNRKLPGNEELIKLYEFGYTAEEIATYYGTTAASVRTALWRIKRQQMRSCVSL